MFVRRSAQIAWALGSVEGAAVVADVAGAPELGDVMGVPFAVHPAPASTNAVRAVAARIRHIASP